MALGVLRSKQLVFTLYGDYVRHVGGSIWVGSLIRLLVHFQMSEQSVRSTLLRMTRGGWLQAERVNGKSFYSLTPAGKRLLDEGAARIFDPPPPDQWDGKWRLVAYSIPETQRGKREQLRRELGYLGFGSFTNTLWISPHNLRCQVEQLVGRLELKGNLEFYTASHDGFSDPASLVARCWDLKSINAQYTAFIEKYQPQYSACITKRDTLTPSDCFVQCFMLLHEFRRFPFVDPHLPPGLLENDWHGYQATKLFQDYYALLTDQANAFFDSVFVGPSKIESAQPGKAVLDKEHTAQREKLVYGAAGGDTWEGR